MDAKKCMPTNGCQQMYANKFRRKIASALLRRHFFFLFVPLLFLYQPRNVFCWLQLGLSYFYKPPFNKAKQMTFSRKSLIFLTKCQLKPTSKMTTLPSKNNKRNQAKIIKFLKSKKKEIKRPEKKSLKVYLKFKTKLLMLVFAIYCLILCALMSVTLNPYFKNKVSNFNDSKQEGFLKRCNIILKLRFLRG